jgi:hypothetical protein
LVLGIAEDIKLKECYGNNWRFELEAVIAWNLIRKTAVKFCWFFQVNTELMILRFHSP